MMKRTLYFALAAMALMACQQPKVLTLTVANPTDLSRSNEMVEISMSEVSQRLALTADKKPVVKDSQGNEVPYQITHDGLLIFAATVAPEGEAKYTLTEGKPADVPTIACGKHYPQRVDDIAWENDLVAFRAYGPALQRNGEKAYGYDVWTKRNAPHPVVEERYAMELNPETLARIDSLRKVDPAEANKLRSSTSYHVDHGNGLDCYKVGPTLGGGTSALMTDGGEIVYPYCYNTFEILDNGPLRFTLKLVYNPLTVGSDANVVETRIISLDAGSHLNKTVITYTGLSKETLVATGIVLHEPDAAPTADAAAGYIAYADPTDNPAGDNGKIFVGAAFPAAVQQAMPVMFGDKEKAERGADGHVLAISPYTPGSAYTYYWGAGWSKADIKDAAHWNNYMAQYARQLRNPLKVSIAE